MSHVATCEVTTFSQPVPLNISTRGPNGRPAFNISKGGVTSHPLTKFGCLWSSVAQTTGRTKHEISPILGTFHMFTGGYLALQHVWTETFHSRIGHQPEASWKLEEIAAWKGSTREILSLKVDELRRTSWWTACNISWVPIITPPYLKWISISIFYLDQLHLITSCDSRNPHVISLKGLFNLRGFAFSIRSRISISTT